MSAYTDKRNKEIASSEFYKAQKQEKKFPPLPDHIINSPHVRFYYPRQTKAVTITDSVEAVYLIPLQKVQNDKTTYARRARTPLDQFDAYIERHTVYLNPAPEEEPETEKSNEPLADS
jgi:hypothetical protein